MNNMLSSEKYLKNASKDNNRMLENGGIWYTKNSLNRRY